jgi:hypothetical protein
LYRSPNVISVIKSRRLRWERHIARIKTSSFKLLRGKRPLGRPWHRWEENIRMDLKEIDINTWI